ncbi:MAG: DNA translocase FtsK 4TM domain-containing protein [Alphaproteobacteria bacterium]|nr:DNA translocase FtsK 4TM domain-containing protein [Alphaproteobacteria bacterium]
MPKKKRNFTMPNWAKALLIVILGVLVGISLATYHATDKCWNTASNLPVENWLGVVGAFAADALLQMLGHFALFVPFIIIVLGILIFLKKEHIRWRLLGITVALLLACWMYQGFGGQMSDWFKAGDAGFLGRYFKNWGVIKPMWIRVLIWCGIVVLAIFSLKLPVKRVSEWTGKGLWWGLKKVPVKVPEKIKKPFRAAYVKAQVNKIKKSAPKEKLKASHVDKKKSDIMAELTRGALIGCPQVHCWLRLNLCRVWP